MLWHHHGDLRTMAHLSLSPSLFPGWDNEAWNQRGQPAPCFSQLQSFVKERVAKLDVGLAVWSWKSNCGAFSLPACILSAFRSRDCEEGQGRGRQVGGLCCRCGLVVVVTDPGMGQTSPLKRQENLHFEFSS